MLDLVRGRWEPEEVLNQIVRTAIADGPSVDVILEEEKGSSGKLLAEKLLDGRLENVGEGMVHSRSISGDKTKSALRARRMCRRREPDPGPGAVLGTTTWRGCCLPSPAPNTTTSSTRCSSGLQLAR